MDATLISEKNAELEAGRISFLVQSVRDSVGSAQFTVTSEGLESAIVTIGIEPFSTDHLVPTVESSGHVLPAFPSPYVVNDNKTGSRVNQFSYQGNGWVYGSEKTAYQNDNHYSKQAGDSLSIKFVGTNLKYYGAQAPNHGMAVFSVDGGQGTRVDCYAADRKADAVLYDTGILEYGEHVLTVQVTGEKNAAATDCYINADKVEISSKVPEVVVNDTTIGTGENQFNFQGTWAQSNDVNCYEGNNYWSNSVDAYLLFKFTGTSLKYYSTKAGNIGIAAFSIDGGEEQMIDMYQANKEDQALVYEAVGLEPGMHELKVRVTGEKNAAASDCCIVADKIEVFRGETVCSHGKTELWNKVDANCTKMGYTGDTYCMDCGEKLSEGESIAALGHQWDSGTVTKEPTQTQNGVKTYICTVCKQTRTETLAKLQPTAPKPPKKGDVIKDNSSKAVYKVMTVKTINGKVTGTLRYTKPSSKSVKTANIPAKVTINGGTFTVTSVGDKAFLNHKKLTKVVIGSNVTTIGTSAFSGCGKLKTVTIGKKVTTIGTKAFYKCTSLAKLTIPSKVKKIGKQAFLGCKKLKNITIKTTKLTKKSVGANAFKGISSKAVIKVPKSKLKSYQSILKARGVGKKVKIKK